MIAEEYVVVLLLAILLLQNGEACNIRYCEVSQWSAWSGCFHRCGSAGTEYRTRYKTVVESCGGDCHYDLMEHRDCPKTCLNGGTPSYWGCACRTGYTGSCCELDQNECQMNRYYCIPGGTCVNTHGSYRCFCNQGYVSSHGGTACIADKRDGKANSSTQKSSTKDVEIGCGVGLGGPTLITILWMVRRYYRKRNNRRVNREQHPENNPQHGNVIVGSSAEMINIDKFRAVRKYPDGTEDSITADRLSVPASQMQRLPNLLSAIKQPATLKQA